MDKTWKNEQLEKIASQSALFKHIPEEIGNVLYCDTNQPNEKALSAKEAKHKKILAIAICSIILLLYWAFLYDHYIWGGIITLVAIFFTIGICDTTFSGTDYFVGDNGFATVSFFNSRDKITSCKVYLFKDFEYLFTGETIVKMNYTYSNTKYYFSIFGKLDSETNEYHRLYFAEGTYNDKRPKDPMNPDGANEEYCMLKKVEQVWTSYFVLNHASADTVKFGIIDNEKLYSDAISISPKEIDVNGTLYNASNTKKIYTSNGELVIEHINHSKKFFGFIENGNISSIPLSALGNRSAFLIFFDRLYRG